MRSAFRYLLAILSGLLGAAAEPDFGWWPLVLVSPVLLLLALRGAGGRQGRMLGWVQGLVAFGTGLWWLTRVFGPFAVVLWLVLAMFVAVAGGLIGWASARDGRWPGLAWFAAAVWATLEFIRAEWFWLDFPWQTHGVGLGPTWLSPWVGVYGAGFLVLLAAALLVFGGWRQRVAGGGLAAALLALGTFRPAPVPMAEDGIPALAVQSESCDFHSYLELTRANPEFTDGIILWPEYAVTYDLESDPKRLAEAMELIRTRRATLIVGTQRDLPGGGHHNHALTLEATGRVGSHFKNHPVHLMNDGIPGTATVPAATRFGRIGTPICYDCDYEDVVRRFTLAGAEAFAVPSMDAVRWSATQHRQHGELFRHRALENGRWMLVCATSGLTQLIDPHGNRVAELPLMRDGTLVTRLPRCRELTFFTRCGWLTPWLVGAGALAATGLLGWQAYRSRPPARQPQPEPLAADPSS